MPTVKSFTSTASTSSDPEAPAGSFVIDAERPYKDQKAAVIADFEERYVRQLVKLHKGNVSAAAKARGVVFFQDAVERLMRDRGISRAAAIAAASPPVDAGRAGTLQSIRNGDFGPRSGWNTARSICLDVADVYKGIRYR
jgi:hypothetical protein